MLQGVSKDAKARLLCREGLMIRSCFPVALVLMTSCVPESTTDVEASLSVVAVTPADGASDVLVDTKLRATFNAPINPETLTSQTFAVSPEASGSLTWDGPSRTATYAPNEGLSANTTYTVTLSPGLETEQGEGLESSYAWTFSTGEAGSNPPLGQSETYTFGADTVTLVTSGQPGARSFTMTSTAPLRDNLPPNGTRTFSDTSGQPYVTSDAPLFDALFSMAIDDARLCEVSSITDGAFNNGQGVACSCYETGEKWTYVWTRDTAYAVDLGLFLTDPQRAARSLRFKLSRPLGGGPLQIVQDTGSGGSWPVSTDRVVWALGARRVLPWLPDGERETFEAEALEAIGTTIAVDRDTVYDAPIGLYRGEQSFLDWREQSYPLWTTTDVNHLAESHALSTNAGHHILLSFGAELAERAGDLETAQRWQTWADDLAASMRNTFWLPETSWFSALTGPTLDQTVLERTELLGLSLTVLEDIATASQAEDAIASYPRAIHGPPVLWPQQPLVPIYHNRGIWPFVTAYGLISAKHVGNDAVMAHDMNSLARGAALNLSNMENFEFLTQQAWVDDGPYSGPVVNSRRQLWSVAGYLGGVVRGVFGLESDLNGLSFSPLMPSSTRAEWLGQSDRVTLHDLTFRNASFDITLDLPPATEEGAPLVLASADLDGKALSIVDGRVDVSETTGSHTLTLTLSPAQQAPSDLTVVQDVGRFEDFWSPQEPTNLTVSTAPSVTLTWDNNETAETTFNVYRDGSQIAEGLTSPVYTDTDADLDASSPCYAVASVFTRSGHVSHHTAPVCAWGTADERVIDLGLAHLAAVGPDAQWSVQHGRTHHMDWGGVDNRLEVWAFTPELSGEYLIQPIFGNGAGAVNTGITAGVKRIRVFDADDTLVGNDIVTMPHRGWDNWSEWSGGTFASATLQGGATYRIELTDVANMSYLDHFTPYTAGNGGGPTSYGRVNISALRLLPWKDLALVDTIAPTVDLTGSGDLAKHTLVLQSADLGAPGPGDALGVSADENFLYLTLDHDGFANSYQPWFLYIDADGDPTPVSPADGVEYSGKTPSLPFTPTHMVTARTAVDGGPQGGPWSGVWTFDADGEATQRFRLLDNDHRWVSTDATSMSLRLPLDLFGDATELRWVSHTLDLTTLQWRALHPATHQPEGDGGDFDVLTIE